MREIFLLDKATETWLREKVGDHFEVQKGKRPGVRSNFEFNVVNGPIKIGTRPECGSYDGRTLKVSPSGDLLMPSSVSVFYPLTGFTDKTSGSRDIMVMVREAGRFSTESKVRPIRIIRIHKNREVTVRWLDEQKPDLTVRRAPSGGRVTARRTLA